MIPRRSSNPKRRLAPLDRLGPSGRQAMVGGMTYAGSGLHKLHPGDYGFHPAVNPRPWKSVCDGKRPILKAEASEMLREGALRGFFSDFTDDGKPKYVWAVDGDGEVYEAKIDRDGYHGYRLEDDDDFRPLILKEWARRCSPR